MVESLILGPLVNNQKGFFPFRRRKRTERPTCFVDATVDDQRTVHQFSDAELTAILWRRVGVVAVESDEERPESAALN